MATLRIWGRRIGRAGAAAVVVGLGGVVAWTFAISWRPSAETYPLQGIDLSEEQGAVDWPTVRASGADFAYLRATVGADVRDAAFADHWRGVYAAGIRRGAVHVFSLCRLAADQANNFIVTVPRVADALPAAVTIDLSDDCDSRPDRIVLIGEIERFVAMVENHTGKPVLIGVSRGIEQRYRLTEAIGRPIWAFGNFFPPDYPARPWRMWRASDMKRVEGVANAVGWDVVAQ